LTARAADELIRRLQQRLDAILNHEDDEEEKTEVPFR
jgi:hypothetical protein